MPQEPPMEEVQENSDCCKCTGFLGNSVARGMGITAAGRGAVIASNIFISSSLLYLASQEAGCLDEDGKTTECDEKIYGFQPSSLITNIAVISNVVAAVLNPLMGAVVDFTDHRHALGTICAFLIIGIQAVQVYTVSSTWFIMAILQSVAGAIYQFMLTSTYAYFPEMAEQLGEKAMSNIAPKITITQFSFQATFMVLIIGISIGIGSGDVLTAQISQGINAVILLVCWSIGWFKLLPKSKAKRTLPEGKSLFSAGFSQIFQTAKHINSHYKNSIRWYLLALVFAEAGANSFTICAVTYLNEVLKMSGTETGIVFLIVLVCTIPGSILCEYVVNKTNFNTGWRLNMLYFSIVTTVGVFVLNDENDKIMTYVMGVFWGIALGWFYPTENGFFAVLVPQEQATEMAGIYNFCALVISWCPPFIFTAMNENGIPLNYGLLHLVAYFLIAIALLSMMPSWDVVIAESHGPSSTLVENPTKPDATEA
ncbi:unnamed protein product [Cylindrotheca closterium]|uniref:Major facilitator superfamily (MFS) profile domain-containing protein n=1 Tax=Cylindrotheca closterium TaxID=2856 RepID=A0AAD2JHR6_9STRA|nr:unnamed protein product [Cylindrotheca closterium]